MPGTYKVVTVVGTSATSFSEAAKNAVAEAAKTIRHMGWFEVVEQRGMIKNGQIQEFQVTVSVGFKVDHGELV